MMQENQTEIIENDLRKKNITRRRQLLPWWVKVFLWIFLVFGATAPISMVFGLLGLDFKLALYGMETNDPMSLLGASILILFLYKGVTALSLWLEKDWAITLAEIDALLGIAICLAMVVVPTLFSNSGLQIKYRLELLLLLPFLVKMGRIKKEWMAITTEQE